MEFTATNKLLMSDILRRHRGAITFAEWNTASTIIEDSEYELDFAIARINAHIGKGLTQSEADHFIYLVTRIAGESRERQRHPEAHGRRSLPRVWRREHRLHVDGR